MLDDRLALFPRLGLLACGIGPVLAFYLLRPLPRRLLALPFGLGDVSLGGDVIAADGFNQVSCRTLLDTLVLLRGHPVKDVDFAFDPFRGLLLDEFAGRHLGDATRDQFLHKRVSAWGRLFGLGQRGAAALEIDLPFPSLLAESDILGKGLKEAHGFEFLDGRLELLLDLAVMGVGTAQPDMLEGEVTQLEAQFRSVVEALVEESVHPLRGVKIELHVEPVIQALEIPRLTALEEGFTPGDVGP